MKCLNTYICEKFRLRDDTRLTTPEIRVCDMLYDELSKDEYKLTFKLGSRKLSDKIDMNDFIHEITDDEMKFHHAKLFDCFKNVKKSTDAKYFVMSVWNSGSINFHGDSEYSQGEIVRYRNNTHFKYYILVNDDYTCHICGHQLGGYNQWDVAGHPYEFKMKSK